MTKVLVLGAGGRIARWAIQMLADQGIELTLMLRDANTLADAPDGARVVEGDVLDRERLDPAVRGQDVVYANLAGNVDAQAARIVESMWPYRAAADAIEALTLDFTILRPAWLTDADEISYEITQRDEQFKGTEVSRKSVAALVTDVVTHPERWVRANLGVNKPGTDADKPAFM